MIDEITEFCHKCKTNKPLSAFHKCKWRKHGVHWWCKECRKVHETSKVPCITERRRMPPDKDGQRLCSKCKAWLDISLFRHRPDRPSKRETACRSCQLAIDLEYRTSRRKRVLDHYGNKCAYCGETRIEYLEIDHVHNDGKFHRQRNGDLGKNIVDYLLKNDFPDGFQLLCTSCNLAKSRFSGEMPPLFRRVGSLAWHQAVEWLADQLGGPEVIARELRRLTESRKKCNCPQQESMLLSEQSSKF